MRMVAPVYGFQETSKPANEAANNEAATPTLEERQLALQASLEAIQKQIAALPEDTSAGFRKALESEQEFLERIKNNFSQHVAANDRIKESLSRKEELSKQLEQLQTNGLETPPPYSILDLDTLRDELTSSEARTISLEAAVTAASNAVADAAKALEQKSSKLRLAKEAEQTNSDESRRVEVSAARKSAELETQLATETAALRKTVLKRESLGKDINDLQVKILQLRIQLVSADLVFPKKDLDAKLVEVKTSQSQANQQLKQIEATIGYLERAWMDAKHNLDSSTEESPTLQQEVAIRRLELDSARETIDALNSRLEHLADAEITWTRRFQLAWQPSTKTLPEWKSESESNINDLGIEEQLMLARSKVIRDRLGKISTRIQANDESDKVIRRFLFRQQDYLRSMDQTLSGRLQIIETTRRLHEHLLAEINVETAHVSYMQHLDSYWQSVKSAWNYEVWVVDEHPVTIGKIVIGLLVLCLGFFASRLLSVLIGKRILPRFRLNEGASAAVQSILFYILIITFTLIAFRAVRIPLTAFTVLGGALAIGVGFGSQNIIANFISGLILLAERPVRVGDLIEVDGLIGTVDQIGARSTRVRTGDNVEIVVPNSIFLDQNIVNWTLTEKNIRASVSVGVAYGSSTRDVSRFMLRAVEEHGRIHKKPPPVVLFKEFGDNSLIFEVHFWIAMRGPFDRQMIASDVRYRIDSLFNEANIVIAFPQRDVHLDIRNPIDVRVTNADCFETGESEPK